MVGHDSQYVQTNAFRKDGFIQEPVAFHLCQRFGNTLPEMDLSSKCITSPMLSFG